MSVDAWVRVHEDERPVPIGVQAILEALAWRTPRGGDTTTPITYDELAKISRYSPRSIGRLMAKAIELNAVEIVWSKPGPGGTRYRVNRGQWHVPRDEQADAEKAAHLAEDQGVQPELRLPSTAQSARYSEEEVVRKSRGSSAQSARSSAQSARGNGSDQGEHPPKDLKEIKEAEVADSPKVVDRRLAALTARVNEKWGPS